MCSTRSPTPRRWNWCIAATAVSGKRLAPTHDWIGLGEPGSWCANQIGIPRIVDAGDETWVYFGGATSQHDLWYAEDQEGQEDPSAGAASDPRYALGIGRLRRNGFVSVGAGETREGMVATQPFMSDGDRLVVNAACGPDGYLKVEVHDARDRVLPGRGLSDSDTFTGDSVRHTITWRGDADLPLTKGRRLRALSIRASSRIGGCGS